MTDKNDDLDVGHDLEITKTTRWAYGAGTWVCGTLSGHRFDALVFPEHAGNPEWKIGDSRISKLFSQIENRMACPTAVIREARVPIEFEVPRRGEHSGCSASIIGMHFCY